MSNKNKLFDMDFIIEKAKNSTTHGIYKIARARNKQECLIWILSTLISTSFSAYIISGFFLDYLSFPVTTKVRQFDARVFDFPAVSICGSNPFVTNVAFDFLLDSFSRTYNKTPGMTNLEFINRHLIDHKDHLSYILNSMNDTMKKKMSFSLNDLIIKCEFKKKKCKETDFKW